MPQTIKTFRVFVSSTFTDMRAERHVLQTDVFPRLKALCESKGASFQGVDLRWGVNEEAQLDQKIMDICLGEIARCQKLSPKPNFIILLGDKYGWQPIPSRIPSDEMQLIQEVLTGDEKAIIETWYHKDLNAFPSEFVLQPRGDDCRIYKDWQKVESGLRDILRSAMNRLSFSEEQKIKYFASATHQEIMRGALHPPTDTMEPEEHVFAYLRTIKGLPEDVTASDYIDLTGKSRDTWSKAQLEKLKEDLKSKLPEHIFPYDATWTNGCTLDNAKTFGDRVYDDLKSVIEKQLQDVVDVDPLTREKSLHEEFREQRREHFTGRKEALNAIADYLNSSSHQVLSIIGASGTGKTSLLAKAIDEAHDRKGVTIFRFLGTTSTTSDSSRLLFDLISSITSAYNVGKNTLLREGEDETKFATLTGLQDILPRCLNLATKEKPLLIVLDALDQLFRDFTNLPLDWVPMELPDHVKLVVSALPELKEKLSQTIIYTLGAMPTEEGEELLNTWLNAIGRILAPDQMRLVIDRFASDGTPLYLRLAFEKARRWHSYDTGISLRADMKGVLDEYFGGLGKDHGLLLPKVCGYILSGKYQGLTENELLDLLVLDRSYWRHFLKHCHPDHRQEVKKLKRLPIVVWSRLFLDLQPYLTVRNADGLSIISFYHRKFVDYATKKYLKKPLTHHRLIADYFETAPLYLDEKEESPNVRKVVEQPYQETLSQKWTEVAEKSLANFQFLMAKAKTDMVEGILEDYAFLWDKATDDLKKQLDLWRTFFTERAHILRRGNTEWPAYKILLQLAIEHADDSPLTIAAEKWLAEGHCDWLWLRRIPRLPHTKKSPCLAVFEGHTYVVEGALELSDGRLLSWGDQTLRLWDSHSGACLAVLEGHTDDIKGALELTDGRLLSWGVSTLRLWDGKSGARLAVLGEHIGLVLGALALSDGRLLSWYGSGDNTLRLWDSHKGTCLAVLEGHTDDISGALELSDGRLLSRSYDMTLRLWDGKSGACLAVLEGHTNRGGRADRVRGALELTDGRLLSWGISTLRLWDSKSGACLAILEGHTDKIKGALVLTDGRILSWSDDKTLRLWDGKSGACLAILEGHTDWVNGALELSDRRLLSWASMWDKTLRLWDSHNGACLLVLEGHTGSVDGALELSDERLLSWSGDSGDKTLRLWDVKSGVCLAALVGHTFFVAGALALTDGRLLSWGDSTLRLWDGQSNSSLAVLEGHTAWVEGALVLSDGRLLSWSYDNTLRLWDGKSGECLAVFEGHYSYVLGVLELSDGRLLSWSYDNTLRLWDGKSVVCLAVLEGHTSWVNGALELTDGRLLSWSDDKTLRLWDGKSGASLAVVAEDQVAKLHPEWLHARRKAKNPRMHQVNAFSVDSLDRMAYLCYKSKFSLFAGWHAESAVMARCLLPDGTIVVTQENGQVCVLKLHHGQRRISLAEMEALLTPYRVS